MGVGVIFLLYCGNKMCKDNKFGLFKWHLYVDTNISRYIDDNFNSWLEKLRYMCFRWKSTKLKISYFSRFFTTKLISWQFVGISFNTCVKFDTSDKNEPNLTWNNYLFENLGKKNDFFLNFFRNRGSIFTSGIFWGT